MNFSVASYSFHRLLAEGKQDMFKYITDCKDLGCAQLDPWNGHLVPLIEENKAFMGGRSAMRNTFSDAGVEYTARVKAAADEAGLRFGCLAIDSAHIYESSPAARAINRASAYRWLDVAERLGAAQARVDSGGTPDMPDEQFEIIAEGFGDLIERTRDKGIEVVIENHWGASHLPANVVKMIEMIDGLGLLFDSGNWADGTQEEGWTTCAPYARSVHIKTFEFDQAGDDPTTDVPRVVRLLVAHGYDGCWGIESVPRDGDEYGAARKTAALIERTLKERYS